MTLVTQLAFLKEFRMLTNLSHPNICQLLGVYESDNSTYVVL
jgi:serine/threonine protein kinase